MAGPTKATLEKKIDELTKELAASEDKCDELQTALDEANKQVTVLEAKNSDLDAELHAAKQAAPKSAENGGLSVTTITPSGGILAIGDAHAIDQQWKHPSRATRGFAVDVWGENAEYVANRMVPNRHHPDGIVELADGVFRVKCTDGRQANIVKDKARHHINASELQDKTFVKVSHLGATSVQAKDATRASGIGIVPVIGLVALQAKTAGIAAYHDESGKVSKLVITPQA